MGKKFVKILFGSTKKPRNIYLDDISKAYSYRNKKTPILPKYEDDNDLTMIDDIHSQGFECAITNFPS